MNSKPGGGAKHGIKDMIIVLISHIYQDYRSYRTQSTFLFLIYSRSNTTLR